ncbi:hypothetical protein BH20VER3_BH20VER3_02680 [soil metagenome]
MNQRFKNLIRRVGLGIVHTVGTRLVDSETGLSLGKALVIPWRGQIYIIGLNKPVRPMFATQKRITYWKQELGFTLHPPPDFPHVSDDEGVR